MLTRDQIIASTAKLKRETVNVPAWGGEVLIREFTGKEREEVEGIMLRAEKTGDYKGIRTKVIAMALIDEEGRLLFDKKEVDLLSELSASALEELFKSVCRLSGMSPDKETEGNLQKNPTDMRGSD